MVIGGVKAGRAAAEGAAEKALALARSAGASVLGAQRLGSAPDRRLALRSYRGVADDYDLLTIFGEPYRRRAVDALRLRPGAAVLDVGCGTGLNFPLLRDAVGARGRLVGIEQSPDMIARAGERLGPAVDVTLIEAPAEEADVPLRADAALFCGTHDILRSERALRNVLRQLRPGARVVAGGAKWAPWWQPGSAVLNLWTWQVNLPYVTTFEGFERPWSLLERLLPGLVVEEVLLGGGYIAAGTVPARRRATARAR
jgi:demethylmenaquinone methyltransferase/2-methoxy-6-polyprenyl-1,4-benzoquinol methylase